MREVGLASTVLITVQGAIRQHPDQRVTRVGLRIGEEAGVDSESLRCCLNALVKGSDMDPLGCEIESCPGAGMEISFLETSAIRRPN